MHSPIQECEEVQQTQNGDHAGVYLPHDFTFVNIREYLLCGPGLENRFLRLKFIVDRRATTW